MKILLIDDAKKPDNLIDPNSEYSDSFEQVKENIISVARTGEEGIKLLECFKYDLLLLDHDLGEGMNGMAVIRWLEDYPQHLPPKVYLVTLNMPMGYVMLETLQRWFKEGKILQYHWVK